MQAAVYRGKDDVRVERLPIPTVGPGEALIRVVACGVCGTDVKKVTHGLMDPPRVFGHETAGVIERLGEGVQGFAVGDRVAIYHHVPDVSSWWSRRGLYAQDPLYKRTGATAGFEPAGGGFAQYVRVMPWIIERGGLVAIPEHVGLDEASFIEPVNTCLKGIRALELRREEVVLVTGAGSIGILLMQLLVREGAQVLMTDPLRGRRARARALGAHAVIDPLTEDVAAICREHTEGRGADHAVIAAGGAAPVRDGINATRPGAKIMLFASTYRGEEVGVDIGELCMSEKALVGSYSASVEVAEEAARVVLQREIDVRSLITHRYPLSETPEAIRRAAEPAGDVCKVVVLPSTS